MFKGRFRFIVAILAVAVIALCISGGEESSAKVHDSASRIPGRHSCDTLPESSPELHRGVEDALDDAAVSRATNDVIVEGKVAHLVADPIGNAVITSPKHVIDATIRLDGEDSDFCDFATIRLLDPSTGFERDRMHVEFYGQPIQIVSSVLPVDLEFQVMERRVETIRVDGLRVEVLLKRAPLLEVEVVGFAEANEGLKGDFQLNLENVGNINEDSYCEPISRTDSIARFRLRRCGTYRAIVRITVADSKRKLLYSGHRCCLSPSPEQITVLAGDGDRRVSVFLDRELLTTRIEESRSRLRTDPGPLRRPRRRGR